jgi:hypothetical protein
MVMDAIGGGLLRGKVTPCGVNSTTSNPSQGNVRSALLLRISSDHFPIVLKAARMPAINGAMFERIIDTAFLFTCRDTTHQAQLVQ